MSGKPKTDSHQRHTTPQAEELAQAKQEAQQATDQYLRTLAEFDNAKKRLQREKTEFIQYASETVVRALLPILDSLDQARVAAEKPSDPAAVAQGVRLIQQQLLGLLEKEGVRRISTIGEPFDPHRHEAVSQVEQDGSAENEILEEVHVGYTMHGKVLRPAMVKVAKASDRPEPGGPTGQSATHDHPTSSGGDHGKSHRD